MSVKIITDSGADTGKFVDEDLTTIPLTIRFGKDEFQDNVDLSHHEFYEKLEASDELPKTSNPGPYAFGKAIAEGLKDHDEVLVITLSSKLSGTYQSACLAAHEFENVWVVDSGNIALGQMIIVKLALQLAKEGKSAGEIAAVIQEKKDDVVLAAVMETLDYVRKGGRLPATAAFVGNILSIKPICGIKDGEVVVLGKARGHKKGEALLTQFVKDSGGIDFSLPFSFGYTGQDPTGVEKYIEAHKDELGCGEECPYSSVGSTIGTYVGPEAVGLAYFKKH